MIVLEEVAEAGEAAATTLLEVALEFVGLGLEGAGQVFEEVEVDVEVADTAGGLDDRAAQTDESGDPPGCFGRLGEEVEFGGDATEGGTEDMDRLGLGLGEHVVDGLF